MNDLLYILWPLIVLTAGAVLLFLAGLFQRPALVRRLPYWTFLALLIALLVGAYYPLGSTDATLEMVSSDGSLRLSATSLMVLYIGLALGALLLLISWNPDRFRSGQPP